MTKQEVVGLLIYDKEIIMSLKNIWLSTILAGCSSIVGASPISDQYFCKLPALNSLEQKKLEAFLEGWKGFSKSSSYDHDLEDNDVAMSLIFRLMSKGQEYGDMLEWIDRDVDTDRAKKMLQTFCQRVQQDRELTNLVKNFVGFCCKHLLLCVNCIKTSPYRAKIEAGDLSEKEMMELAKAYIPQNIDVVQTTIEYAILSHGYLKKHFDSKKSLTTDDLCQVLKELGVAYKLPKQGLDIWNDFIMAIQNGLKDLPQDVRNQIVKPIEDAIRKPELEIGMKLVTSMAKMRREIIATHGADQGKLIGYGKLIDQIIAQMHKASAQTAASKKQSTRNAGMILERLIFKK